MNKRPSLRAAIDQNCKDCCYDPQLLGSGSWRGQVEACTVTKCAMFPVRPMMIRRGDKSDELSLDLIE